MGVTFTQSGSFNKTVKNFISKGYKATQPTLNTLNRLRITHALTCKKLFNALVSSTVLYAAPVWSPAHLPKLEKVQNTFFRKLLILPRNTPGYAIRNEVNLDKLELNCFKLILNYTQKILEMEDNRFPKICFYKAKKLAKYDLTNPRFNWFVQIDEFFFKKINESNFWNNLTLEKLKIERNNLITKMRNHLIKED